MEKHKGKEGRYYGPLTQSPVGAGLRPGTLGHLSPSLTSVRGLGGRISVLGTRRAYLFFFNHSPPVPVFAPHHQTIWCTFSLCLRIWPILCTQFMAMAMVVVGSGGCDISCCCSLIFQLMQGALQGGLWSSAVYLGDFPR